MLVEAIGQLPAKITWDAINEQLGLPKSTFHTNWKQEGRGKAAQVLKVCVGLYRMGLIRTLDELGFTPGEIDDLRFLFDATMAPKLARMGDAVPRSLFGKGGASSPPTQTPPPGGTVAEAPAPSPSAVRASPAPVLLSRQQPVIHATLTLADESRVQADFYDPIRRDLRKQFHWPDDAAAWAVIALRELVTNAFKHGCRNDNSLPVSFSVEASQEGHILTIIVNSPGPGFDFKLTRAQISEEDVRDPEKTSGRALYFIGEQAKELSGSDDGREIKVVMERYAIDRILDHAVTHRYDYRCHNNAIIQLYNVNDYIIAVVRLPEHCLLNKFDLDRDDCRKILDSVATPIRGAILDATYVIDFDSPSTGPVIFLWKFLWTRTTNFCILQGYVMREFFRMTRLPGATPASFDEAIAYLLDNTETQRDRPR